MTDEADAEGRMLKEGERGPLRPCHKCGKPDGEVLVPCYCRKVRYQWEYVDPGDGSCNAGTEEGLSDETVPGCRHCKGSGNRWKRADGHSCIRVLQKRVKELEARLT
jgi:hypothetical protein